MGHMVKAVSQESLLSDAVKNSMQEQVLTSEAKELVEFASSRCAFGEGGVVMGQVCFW